MHLWEMFYNILALKISVHEKSANNLESDQEFSLFQRLLINIVLQFMELFWEKSHALGKISWTFRLNIKTNHHLTDYNFLCMWRALKFGHAHAQRYMYRINHNFMEKVYNAHFTFHFLSFRLHDWIPIFFAQT